MISCRHGEILVHDSSSGVTESRANHDHMNKETGFMHIDKKFAFPGV
jgi:hypothetical protein